jgi:hypothetical protein
MFKCNKIALVNNGQRSNAPPFSVMKCNKMAKELANDRHVNDAETTFETSTISVFFDDDDNILKTTAQQDQQDGERCSLPMIECNAPPPQPR